MEDLQGYSLWKPCLFAQIGVSYYRDTTTVTEEHRGNMRAFESIFIGLIEALDFANGDPAGSKLHEVSVAQIHQQNGQPRTASTKKPSAV